MFRPFSLTHAIVIVAFIVCCSIAIGYARGHRDTTDLRRGERRFAWINFGVWLLVQAWTMLPRNFVFKTALPLHVCDLASPIATIAMLRPDWRVARTMLYFWGIGLCTQAFFTPELEKGPA